MEDHYLARHPIFDRAGVVIGYELLYRSSEGCNRACVIDDVEATMDVIYRSVIELGLDKAVNAVPAWLNVTPEVLRRGAHLIFAPGRVVLEVFESVMPEPDVLALLDHVAGQGYTVALDDFVVEGPGPAATPCRCGQVGVARYRAPRAGESGRSRSWARRPGSGGKIETHEQHARALAAGADLIQGYFSTKPQVMATRSASPSSLARLALLAKVNDPEVDLDELVRLVTTDVALATKVIHSANSGFAGLRHRVDSVRQAVVLIGLDRMRQLVSLLAMARGTNKPAELFRQALIRAEMAAGLVDLGFTGDYGPVDRDLAFTAGLLSTVDAFTDMPLPEVVRRLGLGDNLRRALIDQEGLLGRILATTLAYEDGTVAAHDPVSIPEAYAAAVRRADVRWAELAVM